MNKILLLYVLLIVALRLPAQQPPAQLPSLLEGTEEEMPLLHPAENPDDIIHKNIFVKATASKNTVYVGEPLLVNYKLYTAINNQARVSKQPSFNGCSVMELFADKDPYIET